MWHGFVIYSKVFTYIPAFFKQLQAFFLPARRVFFAKQLLCHPLVFATLIKRTGVGCAKGFTTLLAEMFLLRPFLMRRNAETHFARLRLFGMLMSKMM